MYISIDGISDKISTQDAAQIYKSFVHFGGSTSISLDNESHRVSQASKPR